MYLLHHTEQTTPRSLSFFVVRQLGRRLKTMEQTFQPVELKVLNIVGFYSARSSETWKPHF